METLPDVARNRTTGILRSRITGVADDLWRARQSFHPVARTLCEMDAHSLHMRGAERLFRHPALADLKTAIHAEMANALHEVAR